jgi:putative glutamine amidotransferase
VSHLVAVSQRVVDASHGERHDSLDQRWHAFLGACELTPLLLPNDPGSALTLLSSVPLRGLLLTGGNTLEHYGGDAPERDRTEIEALAWVRRAGLPALGVCRGMQLILHQCGARMQRVPGHAGTEHVVTGARVVNSFHDFAAVGMAGLLTVLSRAEDGVIEEVRHPNEPIHGVMWHPERATPFAGEDVSLVRRLFGGAVEGGNVQ